MATITTVNNKQLRWPGEESVISSDVVLVVYTVPTRVTCKSKPLCSEGRSQKLSVPVTSP